MKTKLISYFTLVIVLMFSACNEGNEIVEPENPFANLGEGLDLGKEFRYVKKVANLKDAMIILNEWSEQLDKQRVISSNQRGLGVDEELLGFYASLDGGILEITPITEPVPNVDCPQGYTDHEWCLRARCVEEKLAAALAPITEGEGCVDVRVIRSGTGVRVCSKGC